MTAVIAMVVLWIIAGFGKTKTRDEFLVLATTATRYASGVCKPNLTTSEKKKIDADVAAGLRQIDAKGSSETQTIERSIDESLSEEAKLRQDERIRACMVEQAAWFIGKRGGISEPPASQPVSPSADRKPREQTPPVATPAGKQGYVYFEEKNGRATADGRFVTVGIHPMPRYADLKKGQVLEAVGTARLREAPGTNNVIIMEIEGQACVQLLDAPTLPVKVRNATSGGHLHVEEITCPAG